MKIKELGIQYAAARDAVKYASEVHDAAKEHKKSIELELLEEMVNEGVPRIDLEDIGLLSMKTETYMSVTKANEMDFYAYLKANGHGGLFKEYVEGKTLGVFLKMHLQELAEKLMLESEAQSEPIDEITARDKALEFLKTKGVGYFSDKSISLRKSS
jgi:hypothetical protein